ncbi:MAG TPA: hypothetical protein VD962_11685 [Rubricoccaceae bacterium]|nr:hypothetical protein [Rubricoccaceae bacterium]
MRCLFLLLPAVLLTASAQAQIGRGAQEFNGSGSALFDDDFTVINVGMSYGYFLTRNAEIGPSVQITHVSTDDDFGDNSSTSAVIGGFGHLHFGGRRSTSVPFVGFEAGAAVGDGDDGAVFGLVAGGKFFVAPGAALVPAASFQFDDDGNSVFGARFGVSAFLR